jgi:hypothetical protein
MTAATVAAYVLIVVSLAAVAVAAVERAVDGRRPRHGRAGAWRRLSARAGVSLVSSASAIPPARMRPGGGSSAAIGWDAAPAAAAAASRPADPPRLAAAAPMMGYPTLDGRMVYLPFLGPCRIG